MFQCSSLFLRTSSSCLLCMLWISLSKNEFSILWKSFQKQSGGSSFCALQNASLYPPVIKASSRHGLSRHQLWQGFRIKWSSDTTDTDDFVAEWHKLYNAVYIDQLYSFYLKSTFDILFDLCFLSSTLEQYKKASSIDFCIYSLLPLVQF